MSRPHLSVVVDNEGQVHDGCPRCEDVAVEDVAHLEAEVRKLRRKIDRLEADKQAARENDPNRRVIVDLIDHWKLVTGHPKSNSHSADRFDMVRARLREGYTPEQIKLAISGLGHFRYVAGKQRSPTGQPHQRFDQLKHAIDSGERLERMANLGHMARKEDKQ